jgi:hypothetical protein
MSAWELSRTAGKGRFRKSSLLKRPVPSESHLVASNATVGEPTALFSSTCIRETILGGATGASTRELIRGESTGGSMIEPWSRRDGICSRRDGIWSRRGVQLGPSKPGNRLPRRIPTADPPSRGCWEDPSPSKTFPRERPLLRTARD